MSETASHFAVMFADVAGSTKLYETIGDEGARSAIADCLSVLSNITSTHHGHVIKTIGDEVMCRFDLSENALSASLKMQAAIDSQMFSGQSLSIRIGVHYGPAIFEDQDLFGDAVNIAARMAGIAKGRQIIVSNDTLSDLSPEIREKARLFDRAPVKGKAQPIDVYELVWEQEDVTRMIGRIDTAILEAVEIRDELKLSYNGKTLHVTKDAQTHMGRSSDCNIVLASHFASRNHAKIEYRRGKFILTDQSTNGTYVRLEDGQTVYLRREELPLWGAGIISLGDQNLDDNPHIIQFQL